MAQFTWTFDAPTGTFKSHAMSKQLYLAAVEDSVFMDHVRPVQGYGKKMGETVTLTRIRNITEPTTGVLTEAERISEDPFVVNTRAITVVEFGRAVPYTSLAEDLSWFDLDNPIQNKLRNQLRLVLDTRIAAAFTGAQLKYTPTGIASATTATNGTAPAAATGNVNFWHLEEVYDLLYDTYHTPPAVGDDYIGIFRNRGLRGVKRDPAWEEWHKYTDPASKFNGEAGRVERIRLIGTNHANALGNIGTSNVLGEGVVFGEDAVVMAEVLSPEMRAAIPDDFGRNKAVAWYAILEFAEVWNTANAGEARIMHFAST
jgi:N4-gp56 family major capsid protein